MVGKAFAGFAAALTFAITATMAWAGGPMGVGAGGAGGAMGMMGGSMSSGMNRIALSSRASRRDLGGSFHGARSRIKSPQTLVFPTNDPNHYRDIKIVGLLAKGQPGINVD